MFQRTKLFTVYEKPEASDPSDRVMLLPEGFSWMAFLFNFLWLLYARLWLPALAFFVLSAAGFVAVETGSFSEMTNGFYQLWLQLMLGFHAYDLAGWRLKRRGYRMGGLLAAESELAAERRYYEHAA